MLENVIAEIDQQIAKLQQAKALLTGSVAAPAAKRGRPAGAKKTATPRKRRKLTAAGRKAIAEAQRKRWAVIHSGKSKK
jgi:hypothetical protein